MKAVYELKENNSAELLVTVKGERWQKAQKKAFNKIKSDLEIPGFRKGKAPEAKVRQVVSEQTIWYDAIDLIAQEALEFGLEEYKDIRLVDRPALDVQAMTSDEVTLKFLLTVYPEVKLGDYKAVEYKESRVTVTKKMVEEEIARLQQNNSFEVLKEEGAVENGDIAVIDFEGFIDDEPFEGGKATEYPLEIGSGSFIPGFEEQIIGMNIGEEKDIDVTFPKEYAAEVAGKPAVFKVKLEGIKVKQLPELNDDFVEELEIEGVKTVEELTKHIRSDIRERKLQQAEEEATNALLDGICETCEVEIPEAMINSEVEDTYNQYAQRLQAQGISIDMYFQITGMTKEDFKLNLKEEAEKKVRVRLALEAIGKDLGISATKEELEEEYKTMSEQYQMEVEQIKQYIPAEYLAEDVKMKKTLEALKGNKAE
ncbi:MAG: trigger factor [Bacillota bacterium]|jgi:trigger factor|nr:trigger factor [Bacillota bacterium]NLL26706.1 trigger factor [Erysipelotrichia bacterium]